ncbi:zinc finger protein interacting with ribonucleoprotein K-like isoform X6 [Dermacentor albipictus]|uniref:zinc finger protein interacting with ribonucleoprotein K-like isoform X6 n=1 Tax=Dermacentor albipictus TaxID=60249 RepID=UPI0031FD90D5
MQCATAEEICLYQNGESAFHHFHLAQTGLTNAMSLAESIAAKMVCHTPSEAIGQVEVGTQCSFPLADKSVGCCFRAGSESRSVQTTETVDQSSYPSVVIDTLATRESIDENPDGTTTASNAGERVMDPPPQVKRGGGASRPSISPSTASGDNSQQGRLRQDHLCDREAARPISPSTATGDNSQQGCLHQDRLCDYQADKRFCLEAHSRVHTGTHLYTCHLCPKFFFRKHHLKRHLCVHTGDRPFKCPLCLRGFVQRSKVKEHLRTHTGEKPWQCPSCPRRFSQKSSMEEHLCTHTGEKPFKCPSCPLSFSRKSSMEDHFAHSHR